MIKANKKAIVLTGGGTAGHVLPHLALLPYLKTKFDKIYYIGSTKESERALVMGAGAGCGAGAGEGCGAGAGRVAGDGRVAGAGAGSMVGRGVDEFFPLECVKLRRGISVKNVCKNLCIPLGFIKSVRVAKSVLRKIKPDIVFSKGGFVALPVVRSARALKIPVVAHESDATLGLANRLSLSACDVVCTTFPSTAKTGGKFVHTGSPIRASIYSGDRAVVTARHFAGACNDRLGTRPNLLVLGGSLGAVKINTAVWGAQKELCARYNVIHVCGKGKTDRHENPKNNATHDQQRVLVGAETGAYVSLEFVNDIENYLAWADVVVSRAGSNTLCELMVLGKPTLFIPLASGRGDQIDNVNEMTKHNACGVLFERDITPEKFVASVGEVFKNRVTYRKNAKTAVTDGVGAICSQIMGATRRGRAGGGLQVPAEFAP